MSRDRGKKSTNEDEVPPQNPFAELSQLEDLAEGPPIKPDDSAPTRTSRRGQKNTNRGRIDILRQTAHRGGKAVTVVKGFKGIGQPEIKELAKLMQKACGVGGTVKNGCIEIQGDKRDDVKRILTEAGFKPVFAGG
ncbi:MAG: translation initiation factor 1 [Verrucomicrobiales bacterium]|jgi:translation initiation factor 1